MKTLHLSIIVILLVTVGMTGIAFGQYVANQPSSLIKIWTDKPNYASNDTITISGYIDKAKIKYVHGFGIVIYNPNGETYKQDEFAIGQDGRFSYQTKIVGELAVSGLYLVRVWALEAPGMDIGTSFHADVTPNVSILNLVPRQGSVELSYSGNNITETIEYSILVEPRSAGQLFIDIFKNNQFVRTDTLTIHDTTVLGTGGQYYYYKLILSGKKDQDVYKINFKFDGKSVEKIIPITSTNMGIMNDMTSNMSSPLKQFRSGIPAQAVTCKEGLQLMLKKTTGHPACLAPSTASRLAHIGWAEPALITEEGWVDRSK